MTDKRIVCLSCTKERGKITRYVCKRNGYTIPYGTNGIQRSDMWECPVCGHQVLDGFGSPRWFYDGEEREYLHEDMKDVRA